MKAEKQEPLIYFVSNRCSRTLGGVQTIIRLIEAACPEQKFIEIPLTYNKKDLKLEKLPNVTIHSLMAIKGNTFRLQLGMNTIGTALPQATIVPGSKIIVFGVQKLAFLSNADLENNEVIIFQSARPDITFATLGSKKQHETSSTPHDITPFPKIPAILEKKIGFIDKFLFYTEDDRREIMNLLALSGFYHSFRSYIVPNPSKTPREQICRYTKNVMYMGRFDLIQKNIREYIRLADRLYPNYTVNAYGDGVSRNVLELSKVKVRGYIKDIRDVAQDNSILLLLSNNEGFGNVLVEAYSVGMPVIVYDTYPAARSIVVPASGKLLSHDDLDGVVAGIAEILESPESFRRFSDGAFAESAKYIQEDIIAKYLDCIRD